MESLWAISETRKSLPVSSLNLSTMRMEPETRKVNLTGGCVRLLVHVMLGKCKFSLPLSLKLEDSQQ